MSPTSYQTAPPRISIPKLVPHPRSVKAPGARSPASAGAVPGCAGRGRWIFCVQLEAEAYAQGDAARTEDAREGIVAFLQKRPAEFKGK